MCDSYFALHSLYLLGTIFTLFHHCTLLRILARYRLWRLSCVERLVGCLGVKDELAL